MNSVASSLVATLMNSNFSSKQSEVTSTSSGQDFSTVFQKVNNAKSANVDVSASGQDEDKSERIEVQQTIGNQVSDVAKEQVTETKGQKGISEEVKTIIKEVDETPEADESSDTILEALSAYQSAFEQVSEFLGITSEELQQLLTENGITLDELSDVSQLTTIVQEVFGLETTTDLLMNEEAVQSFKDVLTVVQSLEETLDLTKAQMQELVAQVEAFSSAEPLEVERAVETTIASTVDTALKEVVGHEGEGSLTENNLEIINNLDEDMQQGEQSSDGEMSDDGQQTFGEFMSEQLTQMKEVPTSTQATTEYQEVLTKEVMDQIVTKAIVRLNGDSTSVELQLNPEQLGKVAVSITAEQGVIKGQFFTENSVVKEMLESNMVQLKEQLEAQGIKVDKIEVTIGSSNQFLNQQQEGKNKQQYGTSKNKVGRINRMMQMSDISEMAEASETQPSIGMEAHTVEYSA